MAAVTILRGGLLKKETAVGIRIAWRPAGFSKLLQPRSYTLLRAWFSSLRAHLAMETVLPAEGTWQLRSKGHRCARTTTPAPAAWRHSSFEIRAYSGCSFVTLAWEKRQERSTVGSSFFIFLNFFKNIFINFWKYWWFTTTLLFSVVQKGIQIYIYTYTCSSDSLPIKVTKLCQPKPNTELVCNIE